MAFGQLVLRTTVGGLMAGHGLQKLVGAFDGPGLDGVEGMMRGLGLHPPRRNALAVAVTETFGGAALALGVATPAAAACVVGAMVTAVRTVHWKNGVWNTKGGWEFNALIAAAAVAIAADGPGVISFDAILGRARWGIAGGLFAVAAGVAGSYAVTELARRAAPPEQAPDPATPAAD